MKPETLQLLQTADDAKSCENPIGFDWDKAMARVRSLQPEVEAIIGRRLELDENVQDASFFTELAAYVPSVKPKHMEAAIAITFSAFGDLFTVWSSAPDEIPATVVEKVVTAVQGHGFHYVDGDSLSEQYIGDNPVFRENNWSYRFFSYL